GVAERYRGAVVATAVEPGGAAGKHVRGRESAWFRADAAQARVPGFWRCRSALRTAAEPLGRAARRLGAGPRAPGGNPDRGRVPGQHRGGLAPRRSPRAGTRAALRLPAPLV